MKKVWCKTRVLHPSNLVMCVVRRLHDYSNLGFSPLLAFALGFPKSRCLNVVLFQTTFTIFVFPRKSLVNLLLFGNKAAHHSSHLIAGLRAQSSWEHGSYTLSFILKFFQSESKRRVFVGKELVSVDEFGELSLLAVSALLSWDAVLEHKDFLLGEMLVTKLLFHCLNFTSVMRWTFLFFTLCLSSSNGLRSLQVFSWVALRVWEGLKGRADGVLGLSLAQSDIGYLGLLSVWFLTLF